MNTVDTETEWKAARERSREADRLEDAKEDVREERLRARDRVLNLKRAEDRLLAVRALQKKKSGVTS